MIERQRCFALYAQGNLQAHLVLRFLLLSESVFTRFYIEKVDQDLEPVSSALTNDGA